MQRKNGTGDLAIEWRMKRELGERQVTKLKRLLEALGELEEALRDYPDRKPNCENAAVYDFHFKRRKEDLESELQKQGVEPQPNAIDMHRVKEFNWPSSAEAHTFVSEIRSGNALLAQSLGFETPELDGRSQRGAIERARAFAQGVVDTLELQSLKSQAP